MIKYLIISLLWLLSIVNSFSQSNSSLVAFVTDKDSGLPISSASVIIKEAGWATKTTGNDGKAFFDKSMPIGEIHYIISKEGYQGIEGAFNITTEEKSNTLNIKLSKFRDDMLLITGEVVDENDRDLEGALVEVKVADIVRTAKTDASGNYKIELALNKSKYDVSTLKLEAKCANGIGKKTETIDLIRKNVIYKDFKINCGGGKNGMEKEELMPMQQDEIDGIKISIVKCEIEGQRLNCHLLYENVSNEMSKSVPVEGATNKVIDENGNSYRSSTNSVGNVEQRGSGNRRCELIKGTKVKGKMEFIIGDANISKLASLEIFTGGRNHKFYNIKIN